MNFLRIPIVIALTAVSLSMTPDAAAETLFAMGRFGNDSTLLSVTISPFSVSSIGTSNLGRFSGLEFQPDSNTLFASSGFAGSNPGSLFTVNLATGAATLIGTTGFAEVPAIALDLNGTMFGSTGIDKTLITIDTNTGVGTAVGSFGANVPQMGGLAIDPATGILYGAGGGSADNFFSIDKLTGAATVLGSLTEAGTGNSLPNNLAGLAFDPSGNLFGSLGGMDGSIISIDVPNIEFTILGDAFNGSVSDIAFVPEPTTFHLLAVGAGIAFVGCRRRERPSRV